MWWCGVVEDGAVDLACDGDWRLRLKDFFLVVGDRKKKEEGKPVVGRKT